MKLLTSFITIVFVAVVMIPFIKVKGKGIIAVSAVFMMAIVSSIFACKALIGIESGYLLPGSFVTGPIPIRIDALSGWFILVINFTFLTGAWYGFHYMKAYRQQVNNLSLHGIAFVLVHAALLSICAIQNMIVFLIAWEIMALASFVLVIFEHQKRETLKAGINFLIQSHVSIVFIMLAFIWVACRMGSLDFKAIGEFSGTYSLFSSLALFLCFFIGFAIKAGFVPFHTWLPYAHPAAPSHISGVMSGVIIKIGIYGILRMILLIKSDYAVMGYVILVISVISGVYGVMLAILQHNLKKLLAYHSVENIGIIGIGIGLGCIGLGNGNHMLSVLGFAGAFLHTLNHSLFKSLLFFSAGNVYQAVHHMQIDKLGGLMKRMPHTGFLFLVASLAICGLPPLNGFVSEFMIYSGMFNCLKGADITSLALLIISISGLTLIGGLALLCFTKAFGTIFLGNSRSTLEVSKESSLGKLIPMYAILSLMMFIGLFPQYVIRLLTEPLKLFTNDQNGQPAFIQVTMPDLLVKIGYAGFVFLALIGLVFLIRRMVTSRRSESVQETWGCAYVAPTSRLQYTASSFIRSYRKLAEPLLLIHKHKDDIHGVFPIHACHMTHPDDKIEKWLIRYPLIHLKHFFNRFTFLQNGNPQVYVLYGMVFIMLVLLIPLVFEAFQTFVHFLNQL
jgi:hydrogenase-4 component B